MSTSDHLLDASATLRAAIDAHPELAEELAGADAAIGRAIAERRTATRETRTELGAIRRAVAGIERTLTAGGGEAAASGTDLAPLRALCGDGGE